MGSRTIDELRKLLHLPDVEYGRESIRRRKWQEPLPAALQKPVSYTHLDVYKRQARLGSVWLFYIAALRTVDGNAAGKASFAVVSGDLSSPQDIFFPGAWKGRFQNDMGARNVLGMEPKIMGAS